MFILYSFAVCSITLKICLYADDQYDQYDRTIVSFGYWSSKHEIHKNASKYLMFNEMLLSAHDLLKFSSISCFFNRSEGICPFTVFSYGFQGLGTAISLIRFNCNIYFHVFCGKISLFFPFILRKNKSTFMCVEQLLNSINIPSMPSVNNCIIEMPFWQWNYV